VAHRRRPAGGDRAMRRLVDRRERGDGGGASLEVVGLLPVVVAIVLAVMQGAAAVYATQAATDAARQAARAASLGQAPGPAAQAALPGGLSTQSVTTFGPDHGVRVTVAIPRIVPLGPPTVTREAVLP
jgi:Flp pilus assembly protein TadG